MPDKPIIGITLDWQPEGDFSSQPHFALREHYFKAIAKAGGIPLAVPHIEGQQQDFLDVIDGLLSPGGEIASPKEWYIDQNAALAYDEGPRTEFELNLIQGLLSQGKPVLGICQGMQFLGGLFGAKMTHNLQEYYDCERDYWGGDQAKPSMDVAIVPNTILSKVLDEELEISVNPHHREALVELPDDVIVSVISPEKIVQAIEIRGYDFAVGVQWHPEYLIEKNSPHLNIFKAFIDHAQKARKK